MGVDAKLVVVCKEEEKMEVMEKILLAVEQCAHHELRSKALSCNLSLQDTLSIKDEVYTRYTEMSTRNFRTFTQCAESPAFRRGRMSLGYNSCSKFCYNSV